MMHIKIGCVTLPDKPLSNLQLDSAARALNIPNFWGVFLRDTLPKKPKEKECGILNLDDTDGSETHWVAWHKDKKSKHYFNSYGLAPPKELLKYLKSPIYYNSEQVQKAGETFCLYVLMEMGKGVDLQHIINNLY